MRYTNVCSYIHNNIEFASRDRRTLVGIRRWIRGAGLKFSPRIRKCLAEFRRFSSPNGGQIAGNLLRQAKFQGFA